MAECSLDLSFLIRDRPFVLMVLGWGGGGGGQRLIFFQQLKQDFFYSQLKYFLCNTSVYNCY